MMASVLDLVKELRSDQWRRQHAFSDDLTECNTLLLDENRTDEERAASVKKWLASKSQPCLFGRLAAGKPDLVDVCVLTERDLRKSDEHISARISDAKQAWKTRAASGEKSALVVIAAADSILLAAPDDELKRLSLKLGGFVLGHTIAADRTYRDYVVLIGTDYASSREFGVGVDYFAAAGDQRWWHDHRIPGGIGFVLNSPGHMALARARQAVAVSAAEKAVQDLIAVHPQFERALARRHSSLKLALEESRTVIDSPGAIHKYAMLTIRKASEQRDAASGPTWERATWLLERPEGLSACPHAHVETDSQIASFDYREYLGWYHTDHTVRSDFFAGTQARPPSLTEPKKLDFRYIFDAAERDHTQLTTGLPLTYPPRCSDAEVEDE